MSASHLYAVYGATGHTGRFVVDELRRRGLAVRVVGRNAHRLKALAADDTCVASLDDARSLSRAFEGAAAVINCAGPFLETATPVIRACLDAGAHYLDVTAEQQSVRDSFGTSAETARRKGLAILPACGFFGGLADLLLGSALEGWSHAEAATVAVFLDSWHPTEGTRATGERNRFPRVVLRNGQLFPVADTTPPDSWTFTPPFGRHPVAPVPLSEIITISRHATVRNVDSLMNRSALAELADPKTEAPKAADERGRSSQNFAMEVRVERGGQARLAVARGVDIYAISAPLVVEAALCVVERQKICGGLTLVQLDKPGTFLAALASVYPGFRFLVQ